MGVCAGHTGVCSESDAARAALVRQCLNRLGQVVGKSSEKIALGQFVPVQNVRNFGLAHCPPNIQFNRFALSLGEQQRITVVLVQ
ncbi:hypothetical protein RKD24_002504 [Streptomyces calvus]